MRKLLLFSIGFVLLFCFYLPADQPGDNPVFISLKATPAFTIPFGENADLFDVGMGGGFAAEIAFPNIPLLYSAVEAGYTLVPSQGTPLMHIVSVDGAAGLSLLFSEKVSVYAYGFAGYYHGLLDDGYELLNNGGFFTGAVVGGSYFFTPSFSIGIEGYYKNYTGLLNTTGISISAGIHFNGKNRNRAILEGYLPLKPEPLQGRGLSIEEISLHPVFPVFYTYYDDNEIGTVTLKNLGKKDVEELSLTLHIKQYMDAPREIPAASSLQTGEELTVPLTALFTEKILSVTEGTKVTAEVAAEYSYKGKRYTEKISETMHVHGRNAMTWDDDRKAAAFITTKDPEVLRLSKRVAGVVRENRRKSVDHNLQRAMGMFEAVRIVGTNYVVDPATPYEDLSENASAVDFLQFPRQTLEYKAGDCDDLSILYTALLESVGVETAFITVPGHIYTAVASSLPPEEVRKTYSDESHLIIVDDNVWIPVEITLLDEGFLSAWREGAKQWREAQDKGKADLYPVHEAWALYEPVGLPGSSGDITLPEEKEVAARFLDELDRFVSREIAPQVARLKSLIQQNNNNYKYINKLGVLYARYGMFEEAEAQFERVLDNEEDYLPALINLGNIAFLEEEMERAVTFYKRASSMDSYNDTVLLNLAKTYHELERYNEAEKTYGILKSSNPELAERFAYLELAGSSTGRADETGSAREVMIWEEE